MTLHEAIAKLLEQKGSAMTTTEIAFEINKNKWYKKKDGSLIAANQISARTRIYEGMFDRNGSTVTLADKPTT